MIPRPSYTELVTKISKAIKATTGYEGDIDSSYLGAIIKPFAAELDLAWSQLESLEKQSNLLTATGSGLDTLGSNIGVPRGTSQKAGTFGGARSVQFTNLTGSTVNIPVNTRVWGSKNPQLAFYTVESINIASGQTGLAHVLAASTGVEFNLPTSWIDRSSLVNNVTVTNLQPLKNGNNDEDDESYRLRLIQEFRKRFVFNPEVCQSLVRSIPNVSEAIVLNNYPGNGAYTVIVDPVDYTNLGETLTLVNILLSKNTTLGTNYYVKGPIYRNLDLTITLTFNSTLIDRESVKNNLISQIRLLLADQPIETGSGSASFDTSIFRGIAYRAASEISDVQVSVNLDSQRLDSSSVITLQQGEKLNLRSIIVE